MYLRTTALQSKHEPDSFLHTRYSFHTGFHLWGNRRGGGHWSAGWINGRHFRCNQKTIFADPSQPGPCGHGVMWKPRTPVSVLLYNFSGIGKCPVPSIPQKLLTAGNHLIKFCIHGGIRFIIRLRGRRFQVLHNAFRNGNSHRNTRLHFVADNPGQIRSPD